MLLNRRPIAKILCAVMAVVGVSMLLPAAVALIHKETSVVFDFLICALPMIIAGLLVIKLTPKEDNAVLRMRDGFFIVAAAWIAMSALGALPFVISGSIPNFFDAFFETASGFTTTGSTIVTDIEALPKGILFWRSFTHWLGGMGVLVLTIALLPMLGIGGQKIMRAETTGPTMDKISFTTNDTARKLYTIYIGMTLLEIILLMFGGLDFFEASTHTFGTVGTGGLSTHSASIGFYGSTYVEMVIAVFMVAAGVNFGLYYYLLTGKPRQMLRDPEFRTYISIVAGCTLFIAAMLLIDKVYSTVGDSLRYSFFQVSSIITTTGYGTADFDTWPTVCRLVLFILMIIGGCAGSTGGGIKVIRLIFAWKVMRRGVRRRLHPDSVEPIKLGGRSVSEEAVSSTVTFLFLYIVTAAVGIFLLSFENTDFETCISSVIACLSNIGPGFGLVGPMGNYAFYSDAAKIVLALIMIAGRIELYAILLPLSPRFWNPAR